MSACRQTTHVSAASNAEPGGTPRREMPGGVSPMNGPILSYANVVQTVVPAVVTVRATSRVRAPQQFPFSDLFKQLLGGGAAPRMPRDHTEVQVALGSGVIIRPDGYIVTNFHVIDGAQDIKIDLSDGHTYPAKITGSDPPSDLAVLHIGASGLPVLPMGNSDTVRVGDVCLALGNPFAIGESVTAGIISAKSRTTSLTGTGSFDDFLQTDAAINQGNSGGALVNTRAQLIGINSQIIAANGGGSVGIGFAIPSNMAKNVSDQLIANHKVRRGSLGVTIQGVTGDIASSLGLPQVRGVLVNSVVPGEPAAKAGIKQGDVILQVNGTDVEGANELRNDIASLGPGADVTLTIWRNGKEQPIHVTLGTLNAQAAAAQNENQNQQEEQGGSAQGTTSKRLGATVQALTPDLASRLGLNRASQGVALVSLDAMGAAAQAGLQSGDVIQEVNRQPVRTPDDLSNALTRSGNRPPLLLVSRQGQTMYIAIPAQ